MEQMLNEKKIQVIETPVPIQTPISPIILTETNSSLPRLKTTQQLLLEMQMNEPSVLSTQTSTVNAILQKKIIDESLQETTKLDYSALHHGKDLNSYQKSSVTSPSNTIVPSGSTLTRQSLSSNANWENGSSAGSPISPLSSSSTASSTSWPLSTTIPEPPLTKSLEQSDLATICASYNTVADLVEDHRRRILAEHDLRELEARPDLLLVPIDQLAFVYEREKLKESNIPSQSNQSSMTTVEKLNQPSNLIALPFIDCPFEFDLELDELVVQHPTMNM